MSLDAEKAFDRIEWEYLHAFTWIKILYSSPVSAVKTNGLTSTYFPLYKGTRQGCCLSTFLFDLAIEPLAIAIREDGEIKGITRGNTTHKTALYADDLLLFVSA